METPWEIEDYDSGDPEYYAAFVTAHCTKCKTEVSFEQGEWGWYYGDPIPWKYCPICGYDGRKNNG